ncbi:class I adenylate-forming enzyme family protein [Catenisphaera adipataccumulans]|uniref:Acyl-CoA synthetase n=1 Tax=Catenisphaera adipataccumulans TaxID=700500 RepID=J7MAP1_9FIRM|nr:class I adenylate-forming enzyme family protein [Catenisphaera adipataccumulans]MBB5182052.1 acyl-CoA synthetase (AMP-forming)/AMP-acid ligase II [Catenisphaera adipataccumulans]BAM37972.1 acyl-CoA synthetase [Catenisphaera adipataccumulans]
MPITYLLERNARLYGDETALVEINPEVTEPQRVTWKEYELIQPTSTSYYRREITWSVFDEKANRVANLLQKKGIQKGQKCAILLMNCLEWLPIYFGILKCGAIAVPLNFRYTADEIAYCIDKADVDVLFFGETFIGRIESIADEIGQKRLLFYVGNDCPSFAEDYQESTANCSSLAPKVLIEDEDYAAIYFSSGTTGFPKAILLRHQALMQSAHMEQIHHETTHDDVFLCIPPLYHTGAKMHWFGSLYTGSKAVLLKGNKPKAIFRAVSNERCTIVWLLVPWAQDILTALDSGELKKEDYHLDQWRLMHIGAQPVPPSLIRHWQRYFPGQKYDTNYGLSESTGPGCVHLGMDHIDKVGAIGLPGFGWKAKLINEDGSPTADGEVGELCVKGPGVMVEYYKDPQATAETLVDGWLHTGDMARQDEDGFYYLVDRKKDVIISGGENLYPVQIEDFLAAYNKIQDVAVIGTPDPRLGEIATAIIEIKPGMTCTEDEINQFCMKLPRYKRPRRIIFADVPRNATGKIEKPKLRETYNAVRLVEEESKS